MTVSAVVGVFIPVIVLGVAELLKTAKENGLNTAVDTCGFVPRAAIDKVMPFTDMFLYDIKAIEESVHIKCTGQSNRLILENLK